MGVFFNATDMKHENNLSGQTVNVMPHETLPKTGGVTEEYLSLGAGVLSEVSLFVGCSGGHNCFECRD